MGFQVGFPDLDSSVLIRFLRRPQDRRYLGGSASLFGITFKVSVAIFVVGAEQLQPLSTNAQ